MLRRQFDLIAGIQIKSGIAKKSQAQQFAATLEDCTFYTGKPYDAKEGGYLYKYRVYDPNISRWRSFDSSGFPDGANSSIYINNHAVSSLDPDALAEINFTGSASYQVPNTNVTLNPTDKGKFTYTLDSKGEHFTGPATGKWEGPQSGTFTYSFNNGNSYIFTHSTLKQLSAGTTEPNSHGQKQDYIVLEAYFDLATTTVTTAGSSTSHTPYLAWTQTISGNVYE